MSEYDIAIKIAGQLEGSFKNAIKGAQMGLSGLGISGKVGSLAMKGVGTAAKATAATMAAAGTAIAGVGAYSANVGKEFESQMSTVAAISGASGAEFDALSDKAKQMGASTSFSATEAGQAMEYMAMAGWKTKEMTDGIEGIMNLAAASGEDLATTSDIVTDAMTGFGMAAGESGHFADILAVASSNANTNVSMMGETFKYVSPVAGSLGYAAEDVAESIGLMANAGIKSSQAGTSLRSIMTRLSTDAGASSKQLGALGTLTKRLGVEFYNADGSARNFNDVISESREAWKGLTSEEQTYIAKKIAGQNAISGWMALMNASGKDVAKLEEAIQNANGAAEAMANVKLDNLEGDITLLKSSTEAFGISVYENMQKPFRGVAKYAKTQMDILNDALSSGGFDGLSKAIGDVLADGVGRIAEAAPEFIDKAAMLAESFVNGLDQNAGKIGESAGRLITSLASAVIRLAPRIAATGIHILASMGQGIADNLPSLKGPALDAVDYLWNAIKDAFKGYLDFLGDDAVAPFTKALSLIPAAIGGFAIFDGAGGAIKGFVTAIKSGGKALPKAAKGFSGAGSQMSSAAKNITATGAGLALAAGGIWLLVDAATRIAGVGPGAVVALAGLGAGIAGFMALAASMGPQLTAGSQGLYAFGAALLMASAGMAVMAMAATQIAQAGPLAFAALALMIGGMAGLLAIAGAFGAQLSAAAPGLLAFGAAVLLAGAGMAVMANASIQLAAAGGPAVAVFAGMAVAVGAFMAVAAALGPTLIAGGAGMILLGAGLIMAAAAMNLMVTAAISLSAAGTPAIVTMAALAAGVLAFGAAAGALAPLLIAGGVALAAFGAGLAVVSGAALLASAALVVISGALPTLATYGTSAAVGITALGGAMVVFGAGAVAAGAGSVAAAAGLTALGAGGALALAAFAPLAAVSAVVSTSIAVIAASATTAAQGLEQLTGFGLKTVGSMTALAAGFAPVAAALVPLAAAFVSAAGGATAFAAAVVAVDTALVAMTAELAISAVSISGIVKAMSAFQAQSAVIGTSADQAGEAFKAFAAQVAPAGSKLLALVGPMTAVAGSAVALAGGLAGAVGSVSALAAVLAGLVAAVTAASAIIQAFSRSMSTGMTQSTTAATTSMTQMQAAVTQAFGQIVSVATQQMGAFAQAIQNGGTQATTQAQTAATNIQNAFNIDLTSSGVNLMQGFINGMNQMRSMVEQTAREIAQSAADAVNSALDIASPSRLMMKSGQYVGEGLAIGMQNRTADVQIAAQAMTQPVQEQGLGMQGFDIPEPRSGIFAETIDGMAAGGQTNNNTTQNVSPVFNYNPTYTIQGNADERAIHEADKMSQREFERMANEWIRNEGRTAFA